MVNVGDKIKLRPEVYKLVAKSYPHDDILVKSRETIYKIDSLSCDLMLIEPISGEGIDSTGVYFDRTTRRIGIHFWPDRDLEKAVIIVVEENKEIYNIKLGNHSCPLCGSKGENMAVKFYCSNKKCKNWHI